MARNRSWTWTVIISLLVGVAGASIFWLYSPYGSQAMGARYQMVADGKQVFLVDLNNGRVWRYFHHTKEGGFSVEDEGFLPIALYYGGKKHYTASEIDPPPGAPGTFPQPLPAGKQP
jgi:hypothetical protein